METGMNEKQSWNIILVFLLLIFGFTAASFLKPDRDYSERENRTLARKPELNAQDVFSGRFEEKYEDYLTDQFILRDAWIALKTRVERTMLRQDINDIYFAQDGYLIEKHTGTFETKLAQDNIAYTADFFKSLAGEMDPSHLTVMIVPNAVDVLREKLPAFASPFDEQLYLSEVREAMPEGVWFDASAVLKEHAGEEIYYRTDHHWKTLGAFYVYQAWAKERGLREMSLSDYVRDVVSDSFEGTIAAKVGIKVEPDRIEAFVPEQAPRCSLVYNEGTEETHSLFQSEALSTRDQYSYFLGGNNALIEVSTDAGTGRRLLVIKDSYSHCAAPFMAEDFDQVDLLDLRYYSKGISQLLAQKHYTDVMLLMNAAGFAEDTSLIRLTG